MISRCFGGKEFVLEIQGRNFENKQELGTVLHLLSLGAKPQHKSSVIKLDTGDFSLGMVTRPQVRFCFNAKTLDLFHR